MYLTNAWHVAAWAHEPGDDLVPRTICDLPVLPYRRENGGAVAMGDLCPHRFAPLHPGKGASRLDHLLARSTGSAAPVLPVV